LRQTYGVLYYLSRTNAPVRYINSLRLFINAQAKWNTFCLAALPEQHGCWLPAGHGARSLAALWIRLISNVPG
jgi:hypothetical protein